MRRKILNETWEQIKTGYAAGVGLREIARKMNIPEGTILAHAKRHGWTQQIQVATQELKVMQSDAIRPMQSVPQSLAAIMADRKGRTKFGLSEYTARAAERAAESDGDLALSRNVRDVAAIGSTLWPEDHNERSILNVAVLTGQYVPAEAPKQVDALEVEGCHQSVAAKIEVTLESRDTDQALGSTSEPVRELSTAEIAAQEKRQKEAEYRERCRHWRHYT
jgi:hypothetical protein